MERAPFNIQDRKIKVAIVGCGRVSQFHVEALTHQSEHFELVALCDANQAAMKKLAEGTNATLYADLTSLLQDSDADVVTLCTPSGHHARQAQQVARAGKHVITEKPMATRYEDAVQMVKTADDEGVRLFVVKQNRYNAPIQALKKALAENKFGKVYFASANVFWMRAQSYYDQAPWRGTWEFDGGALMNQASHYVDLMQWLFGPVSQVQAFSATQARKIEAEDTIAINFAYRSGMLSSLNVTTLTYKDNLEGSLTIIGEKGTVKIEGIALNEINRWEFETMTDDDAEMIKAASYATESVYGFGHRNYYGNVAEVFRGQNTPMTDGRAGLKSLELIIAAYKAARDRVTVPIPLITN